MKRLRKRKQKLEDLELNNSPETMRKKRRAVREQAKLAPTASSSTEYVPLGVCRLDVETWPANGTHDRLEFDDAVGEAEQSVEARPKSVDNTSKPKTTTQEARKARRARAAQRRKDDEANAAVATQLGEKPVDSPAQRGGRRRKFRLRDVQSDEIHAQTKHSPTAVKAS